MYILRHPDGDPSGKMMFQNAYVWLVFVAALDIMFTWVVLWYGGYEANGLAAVMIHTYGPTGLVVYNICSYYLSSCCARWSRGETAGPAGS